MTYPNLAQNLLQADDSGKLYSNFYDAMAAYHAAKVTFTSAEAIEHPSLEQLRTAAQEKARDLVAKARQTNMVLLAQEPPMKVIPTDIGPLNDIVATEMQRLFAAR